MQVCKDLLSPGWNFLTLGALFSLNQVEDAELCEVEGSRARAGRERHLLSRAMLCLRRASATCNQGKPSGWTTAFPKAIVALLVTTPKYKCIYIVEDGNIERNKSQMG